MKRYALAFIAGLFAILSGWSQQRTFESKELLEAASLLSKDAPYAKAVYQFAESYFNMLLTLSPEERLWKLKADDVIIEAGGLDRLHLVNKETALAISSKENRYTFRLSNDDFKVIQISFPMSYQLISQKNLKELEAEFFQELPIYKFHTAKDSLAIDRTSLTETAPHLYVKKGDKYYIDGISNDLYYTESEGVLSLACSEDHLVESIANTLLSEDIPYDYQLDLKVRRYGFKTDELKIPLKQWIAYCKSKGCEVYVGMEEVGKEQVKACVFAVNGLMKYNHVMNVEFPYALLSDKKGEVKADLTIFVPTHNIANLFEEYNLVNKKNKEKK
ncbi:MAG: hypothetical protein LKI39_02405 [Bacteroides sp.]|jgi:hypothetical protein|nr:hypothetical protein [Bacteroides sp.]MCI1681388.1 hypothetical protein [Bacteroides sp.]